MTLSEVRRAVLGFVRKYPGVHERQIERELGLASRLASYHLEWLSAEGLLRRVDEPGFTRYFDARDALDAKDVATLCLLRRPACLALSRILMEGERPATELADALDLAPATTSYHLRALVEGGVATVRKEGRSRIYSLEDEARLRRILARFEPVPGELDTFSAMLDDLFR